MRGTIGDYFLAQACWAQYVHIDCVIGDHSGFGSPLFSLHSDIYLVLIRMSVVRLRLTGKTALKKAQSNLTDGRLDLKGLWPSFAEVLLVPFPHCVSDFFSDLWGGSFPSLGDPHSLLFPLFIGMLVVSGSLYGRSSHLCPYWLREKRA